MELRQLNQFLVLSETLNFRRAAQRLHITQPPLTGSIKKLEAELGVQLFERSTHGVKLTSAGHAAIESARKALLHAENFKRAAVAGAAGKTGFLRIGFVGSATYSVMPHLLLHFHQRFPQVTLQLRESAASDLLPNVLNGATDIALVRKLPGQQVPDGLSMKLLASDYFVLALPDRHPLLRRRNLRLDELSHQNFIAYSDNVSPQLRLMWASAFHEAGFQPRVTQEATQVQTILSLVKTGLGLALVPSSVAGHMPRGVKLKELKGLPTLTRMGIAVATRTDDNLPVVMAFLRIVEETAPVI